MPSLLIFIMLVFYAHPQNFYGRISTSSQRAGSTATHYMTATCINQTIPIGAYLQLTYTAGWTINSATRANSNDFCQNSCTLTSVALAVSGSNIRIDNFFTSLVTNGYVSVGLSIQGIINPTLALTDTITLGLYDSGGTLLQSSTIQLDVIASALTCSAAPINTTVSATTPYTFTITPNANVPLPSTGSLQMNFPSQWRNSLSGTAAFSYTSCSNTGSTVSCSPSGNTITVTGLFASAITTSAFTFTLDSIINPGSVQPNSQLHLEYKLANSSVVGACSVTIDSLVATTLSGVTFSVVSNLGVLNFTSVLAPMTTDQLLLTFPSEYWLGDVENVVGRINGTLTKPQIDNIKLTNLNQLVLRPFFDNYINSYQVNISNVYLLYPVQAGTISVTLNRFGYPYSSLTCCNLTSSPTQTMTISSTLSTYLMKSTASYSVSLSTTLQKYGNYIIIDFCSQIAFTPAVALSCYLELYSGSQSLNCTPSTVSQLRVQLTSLNTLDVVLGFQTSSILVVEGITNPSQGSCSLSASLYMSPSNLLQYSPTTSINYLTTKIIEAALTLSNQVVGAISTYTFTVNNTNVLQAGAQLHIYFPGTFSLTGLTCTFDGTATTFSIVNSSHVSIDIPSGQAQYALAGHTFEVIGVINPPSLRPTSSFFLQLQDGGLVLQSITDGLYASLTTLTNFTSLTVTPSNYVAGEAASYTITFSHSLNIPISSVVKLSLQLPNSYLLVNCSTCSEFATFTVSGNTSVTVDKIINPETTVENRSITVTLVIDEYLAIQDTVSSPTFTATPLTYSVVGNSSFMGDAVTTNITIYSLPINTSILIMIIPAQYNVGTVSMYSPSASISHSSSGNTLNISINTIIAQNVTIYLNGLTNPTATSSSSWAINAYTNTQTLLASGTSIISFSAVCGSTCRQCLNTSYCLSCYSNPVVTSLSLLDSTVNTCVSACSSTQYQQGGVCYACNSTCLTCSLFDSNCTSCSSSFLLSGQCLTSCPQGYYSASSACLACSNNCMTCTSSTACLSCLSGFILQANSTCENTCPSGYYNYSQVCTICPTNCTACSQSGCSACAGGNYLMQASVVLCVLSCPQGRYLSSNGSWCEQCQFPCVTCDSTSTNCTSCSSTGIFKFLSSNQCLSVCPDTTYADELNQCQSCMSPCANCYSATNCSSCQNGTYLYSPLGQCVSTCISNTILIGGECIECTSPCLTCSGSLTTCTSCIATYLLISSNNTCTSNCSPPNYPYNGFCSSCLYPCLSCSPTNTSNCSSCASSYLYFSSTCYTTCPTHTYNDTATSCALCSASCSQCSLSPANCTACFNDSYLFNYQCYSTCPANFFQSNGSCVACQSQCTTCPYSYSNECASCANPLNYYNPQTYHCTTACSNPYYATPSVPFECLPCQLPCKTCSGLYTQCSSCYFGHYLLSSSCVSSCPASYYQDSLNNVCVGCASLCATCTVNQCTTCQSGNLFYAGACYASCPTAAPYPYGIYCRNCLITSCILCTSAGLCTLCQAGYLLHPDGSCVSVCPADYEPDFLSNTRCIKKANVAYVQYIQFMEAYKILALPGCLFLLLGTFLLPFAQIKLMAVAFNMAIPQAIVIAQFVVIFTLEGSKLIDDIVTLPSWLGYVVAMIHILLSVGHVLLLWMNMLKGNKNYSDWMEYGSNACRFRAVLTFSLLSKQVIYLLFSGLFRLPMTTLHFRYPPRTFYLTHILYMSLQLALIFLGVIIVLPKQTVQYNSKLFYSSLDLLIIFLLSLIIDLVILFKAQQLAKPTPHQKYILPQISDYTLPAVSQPPENPQGDNPQGLHRSGSDQDLFESQEMKNVDFLSVVDPDDYQEEIPAFGKEDIKEALNSGRFRKQNKKKRGQRRLGGRLGIIEQESQDEEEEKPNIKGKKGKKMKKEKDVGGLRNFIYWKKPKEKKANPGRLFRQNEQTIMSRIRQKESEFDTITQNDMVFQEEIGLDSSSEDYNFNQDSRRALQQPSKINYYDNLFNLNYAEKYHMDESDDQ